MKIYEQLVVYLTNADIEEEVQIKYARMMVTGAYHYELILLLHFSIINKNVLLKDVIEKGTLLSSLKGFKVEDDFASTVVRAMNDLPIEDKNEKNSYFIHESLEQYIDQRAFG